MCSEQANEVPVYASAESCGHTQSKGLENLHSICAYIMNRELGELW